MNPAKHHPPNCGLANTTFTRTFAKKRVSERAFDLAATEVRRVAAPGTVSQVALQDRVLERQASAGYVTDFLVNPVFLQPGYFQPLTFTSSNVSILAAPQSTKIAVYQSAGSCALIATSTDGEASAVSVVTKNVQPATVDTFLDWATGSLAKHCTTQIDDRLIGTLPLFSQQDGTTFIRNSECWAASIDLACVSVWNSTGGRQRAGTLISPRHVLFCAHAGFYPAVGATLKFVTQNNTVVSRTLSAVLTHPDYFSFMLYPDIVVGVLDSDVPAEISFAKVLPADWQARMPSLSAASAVPALRVDQLKRATVADFRGISAGGSFLLQEPATRQAYYAPIIVGDSGHPVFVIINGAPVLLGVFTSGGAGSGTFVTQHKNAINTMMTNLGGGYQLTEVDLSGFPTF
jgi:hypothetical protein